MKKPRFIMIDGPNGVGKSTAARLLQERLTNQSDTPVSMISEPSATTFGRLLRSGEADMSGLPFAMAIAADRLNQYQSLTVKLLEGGTTVITDRYVPSSLVLQRIDGLTLEEIWTYNRLLPPPDIAFYLHQSPEFISEQLGRRAKLSRLEQMGSPQRELDLYEEARTFLDDQGWRQVKIDCRGLGEEEVVDAMMQHLGQL